jgi:carboxypeptidase T
MSPLRFLPRHVAGAFIGVIAVAALLPAAPALAATDFPAGYEAYHTYDEMVADVDAEVAAHPSIIRKFSIGTSYQGRQLWAVKISDNVNVDENEPEMLFDSLTHAREHLTVEMDLYLMHLLVDNYGKKAHITRLVNTREIYILFMLNPDGGEFDIKGGHFHSWRKNRQPIPNATAIGVDLNRNFGYQWGCCGGSSGKPWKETYRGPYPWFAPEDIAYRNFIQGRVVGGVQQISMIISWHSSGKLVLYPYGYTTDPLPSTMTADDHATFVALARKAASLNGYAAEQASALYLSDGTQHDWSYHSQGIFHFVFELGPGGRVNFYPTPDKIARLTTVNRKAVLYMLDQADCPYRAAGLASTHCASAQPAMYQLWLVRRGPIAA